MGSADQVTGSGTRRQQPELKVWHLIAVLVAIIVLDAAWVVASW